MKYNSKNLKIYSAVLIVFSICDVLMAVGYMLMGKYNVKEIADEAKVSETVAMISLIVSLALVALVILAYLYLGIKGLNQANGKCEAGANITIAKIFIVLNAISLLSDILGIVKGSQDYGTLTKDIINMCILFPYIKCAQNS